MSVGEADGTLPLLATAALNSVGYAELLVLDSRVRGNDDLWALPLLTTVASSRHNAPSAMVSVTVTTDTVIDGTVANTGTVKKQNFHTGLDPVSREDDCA